MKKHTLLLVLTFIVALYGCNKDSTDPSNPNSPAGKFGLTIEKIKHSTFGNSVWEHVTGGTVTIEFNLKNSSDGVTEQIRDSVEIKNMGSYQRELQKGKYDIKIISNDESNLADTFVRFVADLKSFDLNTKQVISLTSTSSDGLITISKNLVRNKSVPVFQADGDTRTFKFGLINNFYYLYVKGGTQGSLSFTTKSKNQNIQKSINIPSLTHLNFRLNDTETQVEPVVFTYLNPGLGTQLLTLKLEPSAYSIYHNTYFIVTDENGIILNEVKYQKGTTTFTISSLEPYNKDRFNFYQIKIPQSTGTAPSITGFLQIKKGSIFTSNLPSAAMKPSTSPLKMSLKNSSGFDNLKVSTDMNGISVDNPATLTNAQFSFSDDSKIWAQILKNSKSYYNFLDISKGSLNYELDLDLLTKTPQVKSISSPGNNLSVNISARMEKSYGMKYNFGMYYSQSNQVDYYYPTEVFEEYNTTMYYSIGKFNYVITKTGSSVPASAENFNASFVIQGSTLNDFKPTLSGVSDHYQANFLSLKPDYFLSVSLFSPTSANYTSIKNPDFSQYLDLNSLDLRILKLESFGLYESDEFSESNLWYKNYHTNVNLNSKAVEMTFLK